MSRLLQSYLASYQGLPRKLWLNSVVVLVNRAGAMVFPFLALWLEKENKIELELIGVLLGVYSSGGVAGSVTGGLTCKRLGHVMVQMLSLLFTSVSFTGLLLFNKSTISIGIWMFLVGFFSESFRPANAAHIASLCTEELRPRAFALNRLAVNLGGSIGPVVGGFLATISYTMLFVVDAATCFLGGCLVYFIFKGGIRFNLKSGKPEKNEKGSDSQFSILRRDKVMLLVLASALLIGFVFRQLFSTFPIYLHSSYSLNEPQIGMIFLVNAIIIVLGEMALTKKMEGKNTLMIMAYGCLLLSLGFGILPLGKGLVLAVLAMAIYTVGEMLVFPFIAAYISSRAGEYTGLYMGALTMTFSIVGIIAPLAGLALNAYMENLTWYVCLSFGVVLYVFFNALRRYEEGDKKKNSALQAQ